MHKVGAIWGRFAGRSLRTAGTGKRERDGADGAVDGGGSI